MSTPHYKQVGEMGFEEGPEMAEWIERSTVFRRLACS